MGRERLYKVGNAFCLRLAGPGFAPMLVLAFAATLVAGWLAATNTFEYDLQDVMSGREAALETFREALATFGPDDDVIIALPMAGFDADTFRQALRVRDSIASLTGLAGIFDLALAAGIADRDRLDWVLERPRLFARKLDEIRSRQGLNGFLLGRDERAQAVFVRLGVTGNLEKQELVRRIRDRVAAAIGTGSFHLGGYPVFAERYIFHTMRGNARFLTLSILGAVLVALALLRSLALTLAVGLAVTLPVVWTHGLFALLGYKVSLFSTLLTPIVLFVGLSLSVQFIARYRLARRLEALPERILERALAEALPPSTLCTVTSVLGFASQMFSNMPGVRAFGLFSTLGTGLAFLAVFLLLPGLCRRLAVDAGEGAAEGAAEAGFELRIGRFLARLLPPPRVIFAVTVLATGVVGWGISRLHLGSDPLSVFPPDDPVMVGHRFLDRHFRLGARQISVVLRTGGETFDRIGPFQALVEAERRIASDPEVVSVLSPALVLSDALAGISGRPGQLPRSDGDVEHALRLAVRAFPAWLGALLDHPFCGRARLMVGLRRSDAPGVVRAAARLERLANEAGSRPASRSFPVNGDPEMATSSLDWAERKERRILPVGTTPEGRSIVPAEPPPADQHATAGREVPPTGLPGTESWFTASATGRMLVAALVENEALWLEINSFATALFGILAVIGLGFGTLRALFIGFTANFLPLVMALGTMGWLGRPLDPVTAMVPCLCLGIIVDDTIHIFHEMAAEERRGHGPQRSRAALMLRMGWAILSASLIPILGLGILCFSEFGPIRSFGLYAVLAMTYGIFFDLFLTPALLALTRPRVPKTMWQPSTEEGMDS